MLAHKIGLWNAVAVQKDEVAAAGGSNAQVAHTGCSKAHIRMPHVNQRQPAAFGRCMRDILVSLCRTVVRDNDFKCLVILRGKGSQYDG